MFPLRCVSLSYPAAGAWQMFLSEVCDVTCSSLTSDLHAPAPLHYTRQCPPVVYISNGGRAIQGVLLSHLHSVLPVYIFFQFFLCIVYFYHFVIVKTVTTLLE